MSKLVFGLAAGVGSAALYARGTSFEKTIKVNRVHKMYVGPREVTSRVRTVRDSDGNIYRCSIAPFYGHFGKDSEELWSSMEPDNTYTVKGYGFTYPRFGLYPNLVSSRSVDKGPLRTVSEKQNSANGGVSKSSENAALVVASSTNPSASDYN